MSEILQYFWTLHEKHLNREIKFRRFTSEEYRLLLNPFIKIFETKEIGTSHENRPILRFSLGRGNKKVLLWSQMHGNEPTASMAILDIFNYFAKEADCPYREILLDKLQLHFIPLLNPDGAERYQRRNALGIDINRDFRALVSKEARILRAEAELLQPHYGFNLHDQNKTYGVGKTNKNSVMTFLAPAADENRSLTPSRKKAYSVCDRLAESAEQIFPKQIAKYSDEFEPRAFGDNFQQLGIAVVLIESGYLHGDIEKQTLRKAHFALILEALLEIAEKEPRTTYPVYEDLPENINNRFADILLKNLRYGESKTDILLMREEINSPDFPHRFKNRVLLSDIGDLKDSCAFETYELEGIRLRFSEEPLLEQSPKFHLQNESCEDLFVFDNNFSELMFFLENRKK